MNTNGSSLGLSTKIGFVLFSRTACTVRRRIWTIYRYRPLMSDTGAHGTRKQAITKGLSTNCNPNEQQLSCLPTLRTIKDTHVAMRGYMPFKVNFLNHCHIVGIPAFTGWRLGSYVLILSDQAHLIVLIPVQYTLFLITSPQIDFLGSTSEDKVARHLAFPPSPPFGNHHIWHAKG